MEIRFDLVDTPERLHTLCAMAEEIWHEYFTPLLGEGQVNYMVEKFQSLPAITHQLEHEGYRYYLTMADGKPVGYIGIRPDSDGRLFLSKLYLRKEARGQRLARKAFTFLQELCRKEGYSAIWLTVNRHNDPTVAVYRHFVFCTLREEDTDIGNGYFMNDYIMEAPVKG